MVERVFIGLQHCNNCIKICKLNQEKENSQKNEKFLVKYS